jgi:hypothetical protein
MGTQGGPGNEPKKPEAGIPMYDLPTNAQRTLIVALTVAMQAAMKLVIWPAQLQPKGGSSESRVEALVEQLVREVKDMNAEGIAEADEIAGKDTLQSV